MMMIKVKLSREANRKKYGEEMTLTLEDYVAVVVATEIGIAPLDACKAQAVAARTFAYNSAATGSSISDMSDNDQAFDTTRADNPAYANAKKGAQETAGEILTYEGKPLGKTAHYCSANNGTTKNRRYAWPGSSDVPYLTQRPDPWTQAELKRRQEAGERITYGHGVGMSQYGAMYAARQGESYKSILAFYYPGTAIKRDSAESEGQVSELAKKLIELALKEVGGAYVFGALGERCTPETREAYAKKFSEHAGNIRKVCQVLSGTAKTCAGCRYNGKRIYDCRGFTREMLKAATGRYLQGGGATSQWKDASNWREKGTLENLPDKPCLLFHQNDSNPGVMEHTGIYDGYTGQVIQAGGYGGTGVHVGPLHATRWSHYAIPVLLYSSEGDAGTGGGGTQVKTLKRGDTGEMVKIVQSELTQAGYKLAPTRNDPMGIDGIFGADTEAKIKEYQAARGLPQTGTWGQAEQDSIHRPEPEPEETDKVTLIIDRAIAEIFAAALAESIREKTS